MKARRQLKREVIEREEKISMKWLMIAIIEQAEQMGNFFAFGLDYEKIKEIAEEMLEENCKWIEIKEVIRGKIADMVM